MARSEASRRIERAWSTTQSVIDSVHDGLYRAAASLDRLTLPLRPAAVDPQPYVPGDPAVRRSLTSSALMGFIGSLALLWGASQPTSAFTVKPPPYMLSLPPAWFFGITNPSPLINQTPVPGWDFYVSLVACYGGMVLLMRAWVRLSRLTREHPGLPVKYLAAVMVAWTLPIMFVAPLLSKDAYSYVAQGEMMSHGISPYKYAPVVLGQGGNSYVDWTDPLWWNVTSPYGPAFLGLAGAIQVIVAHNELAALVAFRVVAVFGVVLIGIFLPRLARSFGRDGTAAFVFGVMNPIVLIHLIGGEHNDALMLGLLVAGLALARERHPVLGTVLVAFAGLVKVPALLGIVYIGWDWLGPGTPVRLRIRHVVIAGLVALAVMAAVTQAVGLGWGWVNALGNPDAIRSYLDPATAVGLGLGKLVHAIGLGNHSDLLLTLARGAATALIVLLGLRWLLRADGGMSTMKAIGLTMLAVGILGPVMQPWYLAWGVVLLSPVAEGQLRNVLIWLTLGVTFLGLGDVSFLVSEFSLSSPVLVAAAAAVVLAILFAPLGPRAWEALRDRRAAAVSGPRAPKATAQL